MGMRIFTESGTFNPADYGLTSADMIDVICVGGGESGGSYYATDYKATYTAQVGGNSGYFKLYSGKCPSSPVAVTVGKGYAAPTNSTGTTAGGASSFGVLCTAAGGSRSGGGARGGGSGSGKVGDINNYCGGGGAGGYIPSSPSTSFFSGLTGGTEGVFSGSGGGGGHSLDTTAVCGSGGAGGKYGYYGQPGGCFGAGGGNSTSGNTNKASGGGGGGGYGAGGGGAANTHTGNSTTQVFGGKGADGCVIVFW